MFFSLGAFDHQTASHAAIPNCPVRMRAQPDDATATRCSILPDPNTSKIRIWVIVIVGWGFPHRWDPSELAARAGGARMSTGRPIGRPHPQISPNAQSLCARFGKGAQYSLIDGSRGVLAAWRPYRGGGCRVAAPRRPVFRVFFGSMKN